MKLYCYHLRLIMKRLELEMGRVYYLYHHVQMQKLTIATECGVGPVISRVLRVLTALSSILIARKLSLSLELKF